MRLETTSMFFGVDPVEYVDMIRYRLEEIEFLATTEYGLPPYRIDWSTIAVNTDDMGLVTITVDTDEAQVS